MTFKERSEGCEGVRLEVFRGENDTEGTASACTFKGRGCFLMTHQEEQYDEWSTEGGVIRRKNTGSGMIGSLAFHLSNMGSH